MHCLDIVRVSLGFVDMASLHANTKHFRLIVISFVTSRYTIASGFLAASEVCANARMEMPGKRSDEIAR